METLFIHLDLKVPVCQYHTHQRMWTVSLGVGTLPGCFWDTRFSTIEKEQSQCGWIIEKQSSQMDRKPKIHNCVPARTTFHFGAFLSSGSFVFPPGTGWPEDTDFLPLLTSLTRAHDTPAHCRHLTRVYPW